jgi:hypothetical protein
VALDNRTWIAGTLGLLLGLAIGAGGMYLWLSRASTANHSDGTGGGEARPPLTPDNRQVGGEVVPPDPTEADARASFQAILTRAGIDSEIIKFSRTDWSRRPLGQNYYGVAYEAELAFRADCQIKETFALMWSPQNSADGVGGGMTVTAVDNVKKGDRRKVRGHFGYRLEESQWKLDPQCKINSAK